MDSPPDPRTLVRNIMYYYSTTSINKGITFIKIDGMSGLTCLLVKGMLENEKMLLRCCAILAWGYMTNVHTRNPNYAVDAESPPGS
jgi:hypothetical protein